jgi:antitoxin FitA
LAVLNGVKRTPPLISDYNTGSRRATRRYPGEMTKTIQIRNVPAELHRKLKFRATLDGTSLSNYLLSQILQVAERPTLKELAQRLQSRTPVSYQTSPARILRQGRNRS